MQSLELTQRHQIEEQLHTDRIIKAFRKKKKMAQKRLSRNFTDLKLRFQEEVEKQKLKAAQELCKEEERKLEEAAKQLSAEHGMREEDIRIQIQVVWDIVRAEVEKKLEKDRKEEEERRRTEQIVHEREQQEWEENWAEEEQSSFASDLRQGMRNQDGNRCGGC